MALEYREGVVPIVETRNVCGFSPALIPEDQEMIL
jgi:hypothetical protein